MTNEKISYSGVVIGTKESNHLITLFFQEKGRKASVEIRKEVFRNSRKPKKNDYFEMELYFENGCMVKATYIINNQKHKPKRLTNVSKQKTIMNKTIIRHYEVCYSECKGDTVIIHPLFAKPFAVKKGFFEDGILPRYKDQISVEQNEDGSLKSFTFKDVRHYLQEAPTPSIRP